MDDTVNMNFLQLHINNIHILLILLIHEKTNINKEK